MRQAHGRIGQVATITVLALGNLSSAFAQAPKAPPLPPVPPPSIQIPAPAPPPAKPTTPPYEAQLDRLSELLGVLAFLRNLCGDGDGAAWRDKMSNLIASEARSGTRQDRLAGNYNRGYEAYRLTYRQCTPAARLVISRSLDEGEKLSRDLSLRFGSGE